MKITARLVLLAVMAAFLMQCGGSKKLSSGENPNAPAEKNISELNKQVQKHPNDINLKKELFHEYLNRNLYDQAESVMEKILAQDPSQIDVQFEFGEMEYKRGRFSKAYRAFLTTLQSPAGAVYKTRIANYISGPYMVQQVTSASSDEAFPTFSSDGSKIVYQSNASGNWDIVEMDLTSKSQKVLIASPADEELPTYSPDGKLLLYTSNMEDRRPIDPSFKVRDIFEMKLSDNYSQDLTQSVADDWLPRFSPDGSKIVFVSERSDLRKVPYTQKRSDIYTMQRDGNFQQPLSDAASNEGGPCFSPDGKYIYFHSNRNGTYDIFRMDADGANPVTIIGQTPGDDVNPYVSPDGQHIAFFSNRDGNYEIYLANIDGSEQQRLTFSPAEDLNPVYSPDGKTIAFHSNRNGNYDIYFINLTMPSASMSTSDLIARLNSLAGQ